jgi:hypothetical protein
VDNIGRYTEETHEEFYKNIAINFDEFKQASVEDFNSINKKISNMIPLLEHIHELDQEVDLLKAKQRPKIVYNKKDLKSPLRSVMEDIDEKKLHLSNSRPRDRLPRHNFAEEINYQEKEESEDDFHHKRPRSDHSRDVSPVEEIMNKDLESKRKLQILKKHDAINIKSEKHLKTISKNQITKKKRKSVATPSSHNSSLTFQKTSEHKEDSDLIVEDLSSPHNYPPNIKRTTQVEEFKVSLLLNNRRWMRETSARSQWSI